MPETSNPVESFLSSYFRAHKMRQDEEFRRHQINRLDAEFAYKQTQDRNQQAESARRFDAQQTFQKSQADQTKAHQDELMNFQKAQADRTFGMQGGKILNDAQLAPVKMDMSWLGGGGAPTQAPAMPANAPELPAATMAQPDPRVGPSKASIADSRAQLATEALPVTPLPAIPMRSQSVVPNPQAPDPKSFTEVPGLPGTPSGQHYFAPTPYEKNREVKEADDEFNKFTVDETMANALKDIGAKKGDVLDRRILPTLENAASRRLQRIQQQLQFEDNLAARKQMAQDKMDIQLQLAQIRGKQKGDDEADAEDLGKSLLDNPDFAAKIPSKNIAAVNSWLRKNHGLPMPTPLKSQEAGKADAARTTIEYIADIMEEVKKPEIAANFGPYMGRLQDMTQTFGADLANKDPYLAQRLQKLRTELNYLLFKEGQQLVGGRVPQRVLEEVRKTSPNVHFTLPLLLGSMAGASDNAKKTIIGIEKGRGKGWDTREGFRESLPVTKREITLSKEVQDRIPIGHAMSVGGNTVYHDSADGKFYNVDLQIPDSFRGK